MKLRAWHLLSSFLLGVCAAVGSQGIFDTASDRYGPFDRYRVDAVIQNPGQRSYAALVSYHHGNSSVDVYGIWIGAGTPPEPGSTTPLEGWPALVATAPIAAEQFAWSDNGEAVVTLRGPLEIASGTEPCLFGAAAAETVCVDSGAIRVRVTP